MSDSESRDFDAVDRLVREHLDREAARIDATELRARIEAGRALLSMPVAAVPVRHRRWSRVLGWSMAAAAIVVGAFLGGRSIGPSPAGAATLLRNVRAVYAPGRGPDRCYRVYYAPDPKYWNRKNRLEGPSESVLWTRGDRFWSDCTIGDIHLAIGREEDGTLWVSPSRRKGIKFSGSDPQMPREVAVLRAINSLTVPALVDDVLAGFDLRAEGSASTAADTNSLIWARRKPGRSHPLIASALLEIDPTTDALVRLVLWTVRNGQPSGTVTYTLFDTARRDDADYRLESHLDPDAEIETQRFGPPETNRSKP